MRWTLSVVVLSIVATACGAPAVAPPEPPPATTAAASSSLAAAQERWAASGMSTYRYVFEDDCGECDPAMRAAREVVVWDGNALDPIGDAATVEAMFSAIAAAEETGRPVEATYHPEFGYPTEVWIDRPSRVVDGGTHWVIHDLSAGLPGDPASLTDLETARGLWEASRPPAYEFRTRTFCDCPLEGSIWAQVEGDRIVRWSVDVADGEASLSPITVDAMFDDLARLMAAEGGLVEGGIRFSGSAHYHPALGYPVWLGLDIEVVDDDPELSDLPSRLVFTIGEFRPVAVPTRSANADLEEARDRWQAAALTDYQYRLTVHDVESGSFSDPYTVTVAGDTLDVVTSDGRPADPLDLPAYPIDELLLFIELWHQSGADVDALYDHATGHPVLVAVYRVDRPPLVFSIEALAGP